MYLKYLVNFLRKLHRKKTTNKNTKKKGEGGYGDRRVNSG